jgi:hypothetical protein
MSPALLPLFVGPLRPYADVLVPLFFVGFFVAAGVAIYCRENTVVRRTYVVNFFLALLVVNLFVSIIPVPVVHWHKFSEPREAEKSFTVLRLVDEDGCEIRYNGEAPFEAENIGMQPLIEKMYSEETSAEERREIARYLLGEGTEFRRQVENQSFTRFLRYPAHGLTTWQKWKLERYSEFVAIRSYQVNATTNEAGTEVTSYSERRIDQWRPASPTEPRPPDRPPATCPPMPGGVTV